MTLWLCDQDVEAVDWDYVRPKFQTANFILFVPCLSGRTKELIMKRPVACNGSLSSRRIGRKMLERPRDTPSVAHM